jgi:N-acetylneuraminate synthase
MNSKKYFSIDGRVIGESTSPYVIAELSANHNGDIAVAKNIIAMAKRAGADAVKMQTYTADTLTIDSDLPDFQLTSGLWAGKSLYELYEWAHTPWEWHEKLFDYARKQEITIFSSPFDETAVDLLEDLNAPAYKIASFEAVDLKLIEYVAGTGKPLIISTGMANENEIEAAIDTARNAGCEELAILHCVSGYPAPSEDYNLKTIMDMRKRFAIPVGISDHTLDNITAIGAVSLGACIIEKHVTMDRSAGGPDDSFSIEENELRDLCKDSKTVWQALGKVDYNRKESEKENLKFRRSLYFVKDMMAGDVIQKYHIKSIRPGYGLPPAKYQEVLGKKVRENIVKGTRVSWDILSL